jgi:small subunit ribosomal protein S20
LPNIKSAKKRKKSTYKKHICNKMSKSALHTALRKAKLADADVTVKLAATSMLDKAVTKGIIHKNNAARMKSRISKQISQTI